MLCVQYRERSGSDKNKECFSVSEGTAIFDKQFWSNNKPALSWKMSCMFILAQMTIL